MITSAHEKSFNQLGDAGFFLSGKLAPEGKRLFAQMQMNPLYAHAHKLAIVGLCVKVIFGVFSAVATVLVCKLKVFIL